MPIIKTKSFNLDVLKEQNHKYLQANGYLGISGILDELSFNDGAEVVVADHLIETKDGQKYLSIFNPLLTKVFVNGVFLHPEDITPLRHEHSLDIENGLFKRLTTYEVDKVEITIYSERFLDQVENNLFYSRYKVFTSKPCDLEIEHGFFIADLLEEYTSCFNQIEIDKSQNFLLRSKLPDLDKSLFIYYNYSRNFRHRNQNDDFDYREKYSLRTEANREYEFFKYIGIDFAYDSDDLIKQVDEAAKAGYLVKQEQNQRNWNRLWAVPEIEIANNDLAYKYIKYNLYQLISHRLITPKVKLSRDGFYNSVLNADYTLDFYVFKFFLNTDYAVAKNILLQKISELSQAKEKAKELKKIGAFYTDEKNNYFIGAQIIINLYDYISRTQDQDILSFEALEMVLEIAKFYSQLTQPNAKKTNYQILNVHSIDNSIAKIDNNALLNYLVREAFGRTANLVAMAKVSRRKETEDFLSENAYDKLIDKIRKIRSKIYLQQPNVKKLIEIYDNYFKTEEELVNPDVLNLFVLYPKEFREIVKKANYQYYDAHANASSIGKFLLAISGLDQGYEREANKLFKHLLACNIEDVDNKSNGLQDRLDLGLSAVIYLYIVYGLARLRHDNFLLMADSYTPSDIRRIEFNVLIGENVGRVKIKRNSALVEWSAE
ncbi:MAG: hypothetical protein WCY80_02545 [Candidatus Izemoplasmatales bacterium]